MSLLSPLFFLNSLHLDLDWAGCPGGTTGCVAALPLAREKRKRPLDGRKPSARGVAQRKKQGAQRSMARNAAWLHGAPKASEAAGCSGWGR